MTFEALKCLYPLCLFLLFLFLTVSVFYFVLLSFSGTQTVLKILFTVTIHHLLKN